MGVVIPNVRLATITQSVLAVAEARVALVEYTGGIDAVPVRAAPGCVAIRAASGILVRVEAAAATQVVAGGIHFTAVVRVAIAISGCALAAGDFAAAVAAAD